MLPVAWLWWSSLLPDSYDMAEMGYADWGGGPVGEHASMEGMHGTPVAELTADPDRPADVSETLTVRREDDGGYTVNGTSPGPLLEATVGDLVEVTLVNDNVEDGTTLHWHGIDVPNAEDGVAGVTQDAVLPGEEFVYRFVADQAGTFWYHSHQVSHEQVRQGLLGAIVVHPERVDPDVVDQVAVIHQYDDGPTVNGETGTVASHAQVGQEVRLRVVNTDNGVEPGVGDRRAVPRARRRRHRRQPARGDHRRRVRRAGRRPRRPRLHGAAGWRARRPRRLRGDDASPATRPAAPRRSRRTPTSTCCRTASRPTSASTRRSRTGSSSTRSARGPASSTASPACGGRSTATSTPTSPMFMVSEGDVVTFAITNDSDDAHPMHLHGHHAVVLSRDGEAATGSPWWTDSLEVGVGETYEIAFVADNPGLWMDHCHNLPHAQNGLVAHLMYDGVTSSFRVGDVNHPE